jgi:dTDP-4-amino-4,6-dideoxygalactose transaminase
MTANRWHREGVSKLVQLGLVEEEPAGLVIDLRSEDLRPVVREEESVPFVDLTGIHSEAKEVLLSAIGAVIDRGDFILGEAVARFEGEFADFCGVTHGVGVDSGASALELILRGMGIGPGDEVITVANTFVATVNAIHHSGATPVLVDMEPTTYNIDADQVAAAVTPRTAALLAVHLYGRPADMARLRSIADRHGLALIEDACQAHGATYQGRRAGSLGDAAAFSFYPSKNLGAFGDAGMVVTNNDGLAERIRMLRNVGSIEKYRHEVPGFNRRLDTLQAVVLRWRLEQLDAENADRGRSAAVYGALLEDAPIVFPEAPAENGGSDSVYHLYVIETGERDALAGFLGDRRIATGIHYPIPIHLQPAYADLPYREGDFPATEAAADRILSLPMYPGLTIEKTAYVARAVHEFFAG